jgi:heterodisulfide reductase subunit C
VKGLFVSSAEWERPGFWCYTCAMAKNRKLDPVEFVNTKKHWAVSFGEEDFELAEALCKFSEQLLQNYPNHKLDRAKIGRFLFQVGIQVCEAVPNQLDPIKTGRQDIERLLIQTGLGRIEDHMVQIRREWNVNARISELEALLKWQSRQLVQGRRPVADIQSEFQSKLIKLNKVDAAREAALVILENNDRQSSD